MSLICIAGGIGAGKSAVARVCRLKGYEVYDCDLRAKELMEDSSSLKRKMVEKWGSEALTPDGQIYRKFVAQMVFGNDDNRLWLNSQVHKMVAEDLERFHHRQEDKTCFVETAIPFTSGLYRLCDKVWIVDAPDSLRLQRAMARDNAASCHIQARIEAQKEELQQLPVEMCESIVNDGKSSILLRINELLNHL